MTINRTISQTFKVAGVLTNVTSAKLSDPTGTYGIKRNDTDAVVVADDTAMTNSATGTYQYVLSAEFNVSYTAYIEFVYDGDTIYIEFDLPAVADDYGMVATYASLFERVLHYLFGIRSGASADQTDDVKDCLRDGLNRVYDAHSWSFFEPLKDMTTTAPYTTGTIEVVAGVVTLTGGTFPSWAADGTLKASNSYYSIASRDSATQITLDDTSVAIAASTTYELARPEIPLDALFEDLTGDRLAHYYPGASECYPPIQNVHDQQIRTWQHSNPYFDRPTRYAVRIVEFDPTVGSRKRLVFYPTPDAQYVIRVPMTLRRVAIDAVNLYPVGGEQLSQVILEACLAAAEHNYEEREHVHESRYLELVKLAIQTDQERSSATSLGRDAPRSERGNGNYYDEYSLRSSRIGGLTLDGDSL